MSLVSDEAAPVKRMRLGTRSCAECRRRKVRCILPGNGGGGGGVGSASRGTGGSCEGCILHGVPCVAQKAPPPPPTSHKPGGTYSTSGKRRAPLPPLPPPPPPPPPPLTSGRDHNPGSDADQEKEKDALQQRLDRLESMVRRLCPTIDLDAGGGGELSTLAQPRGPGSSSVISTLDESEEKTGSALASPGSTKLPSAPGSVSMATTAPAPAPADGEDGDRAAVGSTGWDDAPLVSLFRSAMLLQQHQPGKVLAFAQCSRARGDQQAARLISSLASIIPPPAVRLQLLEASQSSWCMLPPCHDGRQKLQDGTLAQAVTFISASLSSGTADLAAKALLWLALCVFSLPFQEVSLRSRLPATAPDLIDIYLSASRDLLSLASDRGGTLDTLEAFNLRVRLCIDTGRPRQAWLASRQALDAAILLGLHRAEARAAGGAREQALWLDMIVLERGLCMMLGLPSAISNSQPGLWPVAAAAAAAAVAVAAMAGPEAGAAPPPPPSVQLRFELARLAGAVVERDQTRGAAGYSVTADLHQAWQRAHGIMPDSFWAVQPPDGMPFAAVHQRQLLKQFYFNVGKHIHLPYMLGATGAEPELAALSRAVCRHAARETIFVHRLMVTWGGPQCMFCELAVFESFSAAVVLAVGLLAESDHQATFASSGTGEGGGYGGGGGGGGRSMAEQQQDKIDQEVLRELTQDLQKMAAVKDCVMATRGAYVISLLLSVLDGTYQPSSEDGSRDMVVPFFGKMRFSIRGSRRRRTGGDDAITPRDHQPPAANTLAVSTIPSAASYSSSPMVSEMSGVSEATPAPCFTLEVSANNTFHGGLAPNHDMFADLAAGDWSAGLDWTHFEDVDWVQVFSGGGQPYHPT